MVFFIIRSYAGDQEITLNRLRFFTLSISTYINSAQAVESKSGVIQRIEVFDENNYAFRIRFEGNPKMCSIGEDWAYIESTNSNYNTKVDALMTAFATGATVYIFTEVSERNRCHVLAITGISK